MNNLYFILLLCLIQRINSRQWIDTSDMADPRLIKNRYKQSTHIDSAQNEQSKIYQNHQYDSILDEFENQFSKADSSIDESLQMEVKKNKKNEILDQCLIERKKFNEDLICYRNLKSLYNRFSSKINNLVSQMQTNRQMIQLHPYAAEFSALVSILKHENCLSAVDDLENLILNLDRLLYKIEPIDLSKEIIYAAIVSSILFCFYYSFKYFNLKYITYMLIFCLVYVHEYYYLIVSKKAEISHNMKKLVNCQNEERDKGLLMRISSYLFNGIFSSFSFKSDSCDFSEDYLYIDAVLKINPLLPLFTIIPKLFAKSAIILFENSAIAFKKFGSQLPIMHMYPFLIIFLMVLLYLAKLFIYRNLEVTRMDKQFKLNLTQFTIGKKSSSYKIKKKSRPATSQIIPSPNNLNSSPFFSDLQINTAHNLRKENKLVKTNYDFSNQLRRVKSLDCILSLSN